MIAKPRRRGTFQASLPGPGFPVGKGRDNRLGKLWTVFRPQTVHSRPTPSGAPVQSMDLGQRIDLNKGFEKNRLIDKTNYYY